MADTDAVRAIADFVNALSVRDGTEGESYAPGMADPFEEYARELRLRDIDPKTRSRYWGIVVAYRRWLGEQRQPDPFSAISIV